MGCGQSSVAAAGVKGDTKPQEPSEPSKPSEPTVAPPSPHKPPHLKSPDEPPPKSEVKLPLPPPQFAEAEPSTPKAEDVAPAASEILTPDAEAPAPAAEELPTSNPNVPGADPAETTRLNEDSVLKARATSKESVDRGADGDRGTEADGDDLGWVSATIKAASTDDAPPAWAVRAASGVEPIAVSDMKTGAEVTVPVLEVKVQMLMGGDWKDSTPEETLQICQHIARRERKFQIKARGQLYDIDLDGDDGEACQTNTKSGKRRKMRVMDIDTAEIPTDSGVRRSESSGLRPEVQKQLDWGPQSMRDGAFRLPLVLKDHPHGQECFSFFENNERKMCGEWAVFYHSYSFAALLYEVQAAVGAVLFRFRSQFATLPRILVHEFNTMFPKGPDAKVLMNLFNTKFASGKRDHHPEFRAVGLSVMCSLWATGPEACPPAVFISGYSCKDLSFRGVLENVLESCYVPKAKVKKLADEIIAVSEEHGLDVTQFGGKPCKSGMAGHLLQIFMKRDLVDKLCYPAKPYGPVDEDRLPLSNYINENKSMQVGQARIIAHPKYFMQASQVRCYVASADKTFHRNRVAFQEKLTGLLDVILGEPSLRLKAATGIYGGKLPSWWSDEDQRTKAKR